jgi:hypothetical protein
MLHRNPEQLSPVLMDSVNQYVRSCCFTRKCYSTVVVVWFVFPNNGLGPVELVDRGGRGG